MNVESIYPKVRKVIAEVLVIEEEEVQLNKRLVNDLGAESIDFLDLIFQLEREFNVKIPRGQLEKEARGSLSDEEFEQKGIITERGVQALKKYLPEVPGEYFIPNMKVNDIPSLFTVETCCNFVINAAPKQDQSHD